MSVIKTITVMGATGSIGQSTLALVRQFPELFSVQALVAGSDAEGLAALAREFRPKIIGLHDLTKLDQLRTALTDLDVEIIAGEAGCIQIAASPVDMVVAGIVGIAGLPSVLAAVQAGQTIALANKEALVSAGGLVMREAARCGAHQRCQAPVPAHCAAAPALPTGWPRPAPAAATALRRQPRATP